jgi:hypothetical protein
MTRSIWIVSLLLFAFHPFSLAAQPAVRDPHIRSLEPELLDDLARGALFSPTLRQLMARVESSDVVVYVVFDRAPSQSMAGRVSLIAAVPGRRYLRIGIDRRSHGCRRLAILGHELQHVVEIADADRVVDQEGVASLYRIIGFRSDVGCQACFDSQLAIDTGLRVQREVLAGMSAAGSR